MAISWHSMINWSQKLFTFYSRLDRSVIIMYHHKLYLLLVILVVSCHAAFEETSRFLTDNGFGHVSQQFVEEEIEVRQIPSLPDQVLADLGVRTVGARLRLRSAASQWVPNQVISFLSLEISFVQIFFQIRLFPFWALRFHLFKSFSSQVDPKM